MAANPPHATVCGKLLDFLVPLLLGAYCVRPETNTVLPRSVPEPDFAIARGTRDDYENRHPGPADLVLLIEVSDTSVDCDRGIKKNIYARSGIVEYWIVNICGHRSKSTRSLQEKESLQTISNASTTVKAIRFLCGLKGGKSLNY